MPSPSALTSDLTVTISSGQPTSWKCSDPHVLSNNGYLRAAENGSNALNNTSVAEEPLLGPVNGTSSTSNSVDTVPVATVVQVQVGLPGAPRTSVVHRGSRTSSGTNAVDKRRLLAGGTHSRERCLVFTVLGLFFTSIVSLLLLLTNRTCVSTNGEFSKYFIYT